MTQRRCQDDSHRALARTRGLADAIGAVCAAALEDPGAVLEELGTRAEELLDADAASIHVAEGEGADLVFRRARLSALGRATGANAAPVWRPTEVELRTLAGGEALFMDDFRAVLPPDDAGRAWLRQVSSALYAPMRAEGQPLGLLVAFWFEPRRSDPEILALAEGLARCAAVALANARLLVSARRSADEARRLADERALSLEAVRQAERKAAQAEKLRALGQMASGVAHDLNQSLALIAGYGELAERAIATDSPDPSAVREALRVVVRAAHDGGETVRRLLAYSRIAETEPPEPIDVGSVLREVARLTAPRWRDAAQAEGRPIRLDVVADATAVVSGWPGSLREALTNLVFNAVDALPRGGVIRLVAMREGDRVVVTVSDDGVGMAPELQARIFEPFFTTKGEAGSGLGLPMVHGVVEQHTAEIVVESAPGAGTTFRLTFPAVEAAPAREDLAVATSAPPSVGRRVLVVDDEPNLTHMAGRVLELAGHVVASAGSGEEAVALLASTPFDVVVSDVAMGAGMTGWDLALHVRERYPGCRFVLATGWGAAIDPDEARERGVDAVVAKPYRVAVLQRAVLGE
jgi:signal transduction histidine kinase